MGNAMIDAIQSNPHDNARHKEFDKPGSEAAKIIAAIQHPEAAAELKEIFDKFDKDHSGGLDLQEWRAFGRYLFEADVEKPLEQGGKEIVNQHEAQEAGNMALVNKNRHGRYTRHAQILIQQVKPKDADAWICNMFAKADKDRGGSITFDEFMSFLQNESKQEAVQQKANLAAALNDPNASSYAQRAAYD